MTRKALAACRLLLHFLLAVITSGLHTAHIILRRGLGRGALPPAAFVRMRYAPMRPGGAALLGCMINLTPGTTTVDIDTERGELLMHVLDTSDVNQLIADIRQHFEPSLCVLFAPQSHS